MKEKEAGNFNLRHSPEKMAIINTDYPGNLGELARGLILIVGAVQVHKRDHVREVRL